MAVPGTNTTHPVAAPLGVDPLPLELSARESYLFSLLTGSGHTPQAVAALTSAVIHERTAFPARTEEQRPVTRTTERILLEPPSIRRACAALIMYRGDQFRSQITHTDFQPLFDAEKATADVQVRFAAVSAALEMVPRDPQYDAQYDAVQQRYSALRLESLSRLGVDLRFDRIVHATFSQVQPNLEELQTLADLLMMSTSAALPHIDELHDLFDLCRNQLDEPMARAIQERFLFHLEQGQSLTNSAWMMVFDVWQEGCGLAPTPDQSNRLHALLLLHLRDFEQLLTGQNSSGLGGPIIALSQLTIAHAHHTSDSEMVTRLLWKIAGSEHLHIDKAEQEFVSTVISAYRPTSEVLTQLTQQIFGELSGLETDSSRDDVLIAQRVQMLARVLAGRDVTTLAPVATLIESELKCRRSSTSAVPAPEYVTHLWDALALLANQCRQQ